MDGELWTDCHQRRHWGGTRGWCRGELGKRGGSTEEKKERQSRSVSKERNRRKNDPHTAAEQPKTREGRLRRQVGGRGGGGEREALCWEAVPLGRALYSTDHPPPTPSVTRHDPIATAETATHGSERARWTRGTPIVGPLVFHLGGDYDSNPRSTAPRGVWGYLNSDGYPKRVPLTPGLGFAERPRSTLQSITALPHRTPSSNRGVSFKLLELPCPAHVEAMPPRSRQCDPPPLPKMREAVHSHSGKGEGYSSQPFRSLFVVSLLLFASVGEALGCCFYRRVWGEITSRVRTSVVEIFARGRVKRNHAAFSTLLHLHHVVF